MNNIRIIGNEFRYYEAKIEEIERPAVAGSRTLDTSGLSHQCCATELCQPDNHQPSQSSIRMYCTGGTSCTPGRHPVYAVRTPLGVDWKPLFIKKTMLSGFLTLKLREEKEEYRSLAKKGPVSNIRPPPNIASISCKGPKFTLKSTYPLDLVLK